MPDESQVSHRLGHLARYIPRINYVLAEYDEVPLVMDLLRALRQELILGIHPLSRGDLMSRQEAFTSDTRFITEREG